jgi:hypothetical protein
MAPAVHDRTVFGRPQLTSKEQNPKSKILTAMSYSVIALDDLFDPKGVG